MKIELTLLRSHRKNLLDAIIISMILARLAVVVMILGFRSYVLVTLITLTYSLIKVSDSPLIKNYEVFSKIIILLEKFPLS